MVSDTETGEEIHRLNWHQAAVNSVAISPDGRRIVSASHDHSVVVWDLEAGRPIHPIAEHHRWVRSVAVSPDGRRIVTGYQQAVAVWDLETGTRFRSTRRA